jgi:UDP-N-acetyl-D-mannosaminuronate dehydrogenase
LRYGFYIGYSPERINPGDEAHTLDKITKIVAGMDEELAIIFYPPYRYTKVNLYYIL